jgi:WD40 repeat protein
VVSASLDETALVWDIHTGTVLTSFRGHVDWVKSAEFSPDGESVLTASDDWTAQLWDADTGVVRAVFVDHQGGLNKAAFSRDGTEIVTASNDGTARIWIVDGPRLIDQARHIVPRTLSKEERDRFGVR